MSILETPRIYFRGQMAWDPITTNNSSSRYNEGEAETIFGASETVQQFRQQAIADVMAGRWNPHGTHRSTFFDTCVSGADVGKGPVAADPFIGAPAAFTGMLVDCEPYGSYSSQLFFDAMSFGVAGGYRIQLPRKARVTARYINFFRYTDPKSSCIAGVASVNWQTSFDKTDPLFLIDPFDSPALKALAAAVAARDVAGIVVAWNAYRTIYYDDPGLVNGNVNPVPMTNAAKALVAKLKAGGWQPNPARSLLVGTIGLWPSGEPAHEPSGRALITNETSAIPVGTAHARLDGNLLTIDMSNSISETGPDLAKQKLGTLHFVAVGADGKTIKKLGKIGEADYDRAAYEKTSGIVRVVVDPAAADFAKTADIELRDDDGKGGYGANVFLQEQALRAIPTQPNLYCTAPAPGVTIPVIVQVLDRGARAGEGVQVTMLGGPSFDIAAVAATGADGTTTFAYAYNSTADGSVDGFAFVAGPHPTLPAAIDTLVTTYMYIRALPPGGEAAALAPTWDNVYRAVLSQWHALAPCMDNWLDLGSEAQVRAYGPLLKKLTDPANFESFRFMPVTRDMTDGERSLLYNFLDGSRPTLMAMGLRAKAAAPAPDDKSRLGRLNRAMRGN